jgi:hypothetical protein
LAFASSEHGEVSEWVAHTSAGEPQRRADRLAHFGPGLGLILLVASCNASGGPPLPSNLGSILEGLTSSLPGQTPAAAPGQPGPVPKTITGTVTLIRTENEVGDGNGLTENGTFIVQVHMKLGLDNGQGIADYVDDGSTWTYEGRYRNWTAPILGICGTEFGHEETIDYSGSGVFPPTTSARGLTATTRQDQEEGWYLDLYGVSDEITGHQTVKSESDSGCQTEQGEVTKEEAIACHAPWTAPATFSFDDPRCDQTGLDQSGTLTGN